MAAKRTPWIALLLLVSCHRHDPAMLRDAQLRRAQRSGVDCGDARPGEPAQPLHDCIVSSFQRRQPFHARFWKQGIDSTVAGGVALDPGGRLFLYDFDSAPCGAPGRCAAKLRETACVRPYIRDAVAGKQLACADPPFNAPPRAAVATTTGHVSDERPMRVGGDVKAPRVVHRVEPRYEACGNVTLRGVPVLEAVIAGDGTVRDVRLLKPIHPCLDRSTVEALEQWRFEPATLHGRPVPVIFNLTVHIHVR